MEKLKEKGKVKKLIIKYAQQLKLSDKVVKSAFKILKDNKKYINSSGVTPKVRSASILYIATILNGEKRTQREVADIASIGVVSLRIRYKELLKEWKSRESRLKNKNKPTSQNSIKDQLLCECGKEDCDIGLLISEYPEDKIKIRIINSKDIDSVVVKLSDLKKRLKELE